MTELHRLEAPAPAHRTEAEEVALKMHEDAMDRSNLGAVKPHSTADAHLTHLVISGDAVYSGAKWLANNVNDLTHQHTLDSQAIMRTVGDIGYNSRGISYESPSAFTERHNNK